MRPPGHRPCRSRSRPALAGALLLALLASPAAAHVPPPVYVTCRLSEEKLTMRVSIDEALFGDWMGMAAASAFGADGAPEDFARDRVQSFLDAYAIVKIDRIPVKGLLESMERVAYQDHGIDWAFVQVVMACGVKGRPNQVAVAWRKYANSLNRMIEPIDAEIGAFGGGAYFEFRENEPEFIWHAPRGEEVPAEAWKPPVVKPERLAIPVLSAVLVLFGLVLLPFALAHRLPRRFALPAAAGFFAMAFLARGALCLEVASPFGPKFRMPDAAQARLVFESLHRNIYRAFDYEKESDIYDTLVQSVKGELLDRVYTEVYESLVMKEQGGAVAKVQSVSIREAVPEIPSDANARFFRVDCRWRVTGQVGHWGHTHQRTNEYAALYTVEHGPEGWRIGDVRISDQHRVEDEPPEGWSDSRGKPKDD
jgi:hypothetical protein